jgi:hypothetical protein
MSPSLRLQKKPLERTRAMQHATATSATLLIPKSFERKVSGQHNRCRAGKR